jgi:hypothetical protein
LFLPAIYGYHIGRSSMVFMFGIFGWCSGIRTYFFKLFL